MLKAIVDREDLNFGIDHRPETPLTRSRTGFTLPDAKRAGPSYISYTSAY